MRQLSMFSKNKLAREILSVQRLFIASLMMGFITSLICFILFKPFKFDGEKYQNWAGPTNSLYGVITPYDMVDGFSDYTDGEVDWNPEEYRTCYENRKTYLLWKILRYGAYGAFFSFTGLIVFRYSVRMQKWVVRNAKTEV